MRQEASDAPREPEKFSDLADTTTRLIRTPEAPSLEDLQPGDMVICGDDWEGAVFAEDATERGVHVRLGRYRYEDERVTNRRTRRAVTLDFAPVMDTSSHAPPGHFFDPDYIQASTDAFALSWDALSAPLAISGPSYEPAENHIPESWVHYLPFPTLNPAQVQAAGKIINGGKVMLVAPTGAGKTVIGMLAVLREIIDQGGKAVWLVPQRTLTAELDRELEAWRDKGLKVVSLSGETKTDARRTKAADLWVATTEKFEALCRATSMKEAVSQVGTVVVDEIHLLGEPSRGPVLESLLARLKADNAGVRLVGLSATAANADQVAEWLGADLLEITWRPTRLTQQVVTIPSGSDKAQDGRWRNAAVTSITKDVTTDGGSVLVFCGSKANCRSTALALAAARGIDTTEIDQADADAVAAACDAAGVGIHYSDWTRRGAAERKFREREIDVLVATSTLAAGVNTPARAVIVRDTTIGPQTMEISMVQQMFGRAGRAGKEPEGWSFLVAAADEAPRWRQRLAAGYTIQSGLQTNLADHLLAEVVQGNVKSRKGAEDWWLSTFAYHQGTHSKTPLTDALTFLEKWRFVEVEETDSADQLVKASRLGAITSKMMVHVLDAANLVSTLHRTPTPKSYSDAEMTLASAVASGVYSLANSPDAPHDQVYPVLRSLEAKGDVHDLDKVPPKALKGRTKATGSEVVLAGMLLALRSAWAVNSKSNQVAGINRAVLNPGIYDTPRHLAWIAATGLIGALPSWASVVALDLGRRIAWHRLEPPRGAGRLLWLCEKVAPGGDHDKAVPALYLKARESGCTSPDNWPFTIPPEEASGDDYGSVLAGIVSTLDVSRGRVESVTGAQVYQPEKDAENNVRWRRTALTGGTGAATSRTAVAFTAAGDCRGTGWMEAFAYIKT